MMEKTIITDKKYLKTNLNWAYTIQGVVIDYLTDTVAITIECLLADKTKIVEQKPQWGTFTTVIRFDIDNSKNPYDEIFKIVEDKVKNHGS